MNKYLISILFIIIFTTTVYASNSIDDHAQIKTKEVSLVSEEPSEGLRMISFDVNERKNVVLCCEMDDANTEQVDYLISIYSENGKFVHGYIVQSDGTVDAKWNGDNLMILWVRDDLVEEFDSEGILVDVRKVNYEQQEEFDHKMHKTADGTQYKRQWCGFYSPADEKLVEINKEGNSIEIYRAYYGLWYVLGFFVWGLVFASLVSIALVHFHRKRTIDLNNCF